MVVVLIGTAVALLLLGVVLGWLLRGQVSRWCPVHGEPLVCTVCRPYPAVARAAVRWRAQPAPTDGPLHAKWSVVRARRTI